MGMKSDKNWAIAVIPAKPSKMVVIPMVGFSSPRNLARTKPIAIDSARIRAQIKIEIIILLDGINDRAFVTYQV